MSAFDNKINIKFLYLSNYTERSSGRCAVLDIAILTEDFKYVEYEIHTNKMAITLNTMQPYHSLLVDYQFTGNTRVYFHDNVKDNEPFKMMLRPVCQQFKIRMRRIKTENMARRLCNIYKSFINEFDSKTRRYKNINIGKKTTLQRIWREVISRNMCPWITEAYDNYLKSKGYREIRYRKQLLRLGMFYILKSYLKCQFDRKTIIRQQDKRISLHNTLPILDNTGLAQTGIFS